MSNISNKAKLPVAMYRLICQATLQVLDDVHLLPVDCHLLDANKA